MFVFFFAANQNNMSTDGLLSIYPRALMWDVLNEKDIIGYLQMKRTRDYIWV